MCIVYIHTIHTYKRTQVDPHLLLLHKKPYAVFTLGSQKQKVCVRNTVRGCRKSWFGQRPVTVVCLVTVVSSKPKATLYPKLSSVMAIKILIRGSDWLFALRSYTNNPSKEADWNLIGCQWRHIIQASLWNVRTCKCKWLLCIWQSGTLSSCFTVQITYVSGNQASARLEFLGSFHHVKLDIMSTNSVKLN
jgi:hypothetical protein